MDENWKANPQALNIILYLWKEIFNSFGFRDGIKTNIPIPTKYSHSAVSPCYVRFTEWVLFSAGCILILSNKIIRIKNVWACTIIWRFQSLIHKLQTVCIGGDIAIHKANQILFTIWRKYAESRHHLMEGLRLYGDFLFLVYGIEWIVNYEHRRASLAKQS